MWLVIRNRQNHRFADATPDERRTMYQPGDLIDMGDWEDGPGRKALENPAMLSIEIHDRSAGELLDEWTPLAGLQARELSINLEGLLAISDHQNNLATAWDDMAPMLEASISPRVVV